MKKPTLNITDFAIILVIGMVTLAVHQKFVAKLLAPKTPVK
jgi:hypothetical protein